MTPSPRIAIIGGGPAGLTLARLLKLQGIPFSLFELDGSGGSRSQGGTLDIHADSGQLALKEAGLFSEFDKHARADGAAQKLIGKDGTVGFADDGSEGSPDRPEIDRLVLRKILLDSLDDGMVTWAKKVVRVLEEATSTKDKPQFAVEFEGGEREGGFELVVGADGAWSRVRGLLTDTRPFYSSITCVEARIDDIDTKYPDLADRLGAGLCLQADGLNALVSQRLGDGSARTYAMVRVEEDWATKCRINWTDEQGSKQALIESKYADWEPLGKDFILRSTGLLTVRPLYMLPVEMKWDTRPGVAIIGDAAHLMTPFAGVGVNLALADALDLSHTIQSHIHESVDWTTALRTFEGKMLKRSHIGAVKTFTNLNNMFSGNSFEVAVRKFVESMMGDRREEANVN